MQRLLREFLRARLRALAGHTRPMEERGGSTSIDIGRNFLYVAALPKSASSLMWLIVSCLQEQSGRADPSKLPDPLPSPYAPLQFNLLDRLKPDSAFSSHAPLTYDTDLFLRAMQCRYIVHLRHPADFIVSLYCHGAERRPPTFVPPHVLDRLIVMDKPKWTYRLSAIDHSVFDMTATTLEQSLSALLRDGALFNAMSWMSDWLAHRDPAVSTVSTYEALMTDFENAIDRLCVFVRGSHIDNDRLSYLKHVQQHGTMKSREHDSVRYPRGWTGECGVFRRYLNDEHISIYNDVVKRFMNSHPNGAKLAEVYGDLSIRS